MIDDHDDNNDGPAFARIDLTTQEGVAGVHAQIELDSAEPIYWVMATLADQGIDPARWRELRVRHRDGRVTSMADTVEEVRAKSWRSFFAGDGVFNDGAH